MTQITTIMPYSEIEITSDFDRLSLLSEGTPKEKISGYSLSFSPKKKHDPCKPQLAGKVTRDVVQVRIRDYDDSSSSSTASSTSSSSPAPVLGKGRGKIIFPQRENVARCDLDRRLEKDMRLAIPLGYSNELIEHHFSHHLDGNLPQAVAPPAENMVPIPANNVALSSLSRNAKKRGKIISSSTNGFVLDNENFPKLK